jgi:hypothetical protein
MGTNYYLKKKACTCCGARDESKTIHIGKGSVGWSFSFHGIPGEIETEKDWKALIDNPDYDIVNEYDEIVDKKEFWEYVESKRKLKNHTTFCRNSKDESIRSHGLKDCWYDNETGSSFSKGEFS